MNAADYAAVGRTLERVISQIDAGAVWLDDLKTPEMARHCLSGALRSAQSAAAMMPARAESQFRPLCQYLLLASRGRRSAISRAREYAGYLLNRHALQSIHEPEVFEHEC